PHVPEPHAASARTVRSARSRGDQLVACARPHRASFAVVPTCRALRDRAGDARLPRRTRLGDGSVAGLHRRAVSSGNSVRFVSKKSTKHDRATKYPRAIYETELLRLQTELIQLKEWVRVENKRLVVVFEGRDAAGKGGVIKRITEYLNPR